MELNVCPSCTSGVPEQALFCPNCATQIRCKSCRTPIEPNWRACINCGILTGEAGNAVKDMAFHPVSPAVNTIEYQETEKSRSIRATFTDSIGNGLTDTLNLILTNRIGTRAVRDQPTAPHTLRHQRGQLPSAPIASHLAQEEIDSIIDADVLSSQDKATGTEDIETIFRQDGDKLVLINKELKETKKIDFVRRLICLFIYYHELHGRDRVTRLELTTILDDNSVNNGNARTWLTKGKELAFYSDGIGLSEQGRTFAIKVIGEILNSAFSPSVHKSRTKRHQTPPEEKIKPQSDSNKIRKTNSSKTGRLVPSLMIQNLIAEGFFNERRTVKGIITHCSATFAYNYKNSDFTAPLSRLLRPPKKLNREKNSEGQYEYFT